MRKLRAPGNPEFAIGSVDEDGNVYLNPEAADLGINRTYIEREIHTQLMTLGERKRIYRAARPANPAGRVVIVVDDGIATGSTVRAALRAIRSRRPAKLVVTAPIAAYETLSALRPEADEIVCLAAPVWLGAIGGFFQDFSQVSDDEVLAVLRAQRAPAIQ